MASLRNLPDELFTLIVDQVKAAGDSLAALAACSKHCQRLVEPATFSSLSIKDSDLSQFSALINSTRFRALRNLQYIFEGRGIAEDKAVLRVSETECVAGSDLLTQKIRTLLQALGDKAKDGVPAHQGLELTLGGSGFQKFPKAIYLKQDTKTYSETKIAWLQVGSLDQAQLPLISCFRNQRIYDHLCDRVAPRSWSALLSRLPGLKKVVLRAFDNERKALKSRREARDAFGTSLQSWPASVTEVDLEYISYAPGNHIYSPPCLTDPTLGYDIFSHELGILSQRLVKLWLRTTTLDLVDFFHCNNDTWPVLEELDFIEVQPFSANGDWYITLDERISIEEYAEHYFDLQAPTLDDLRLHMSEDELPAAMDHPCDSFRTATEPDQFRKIYIAAASAVKRMPKLRVLEISFDIQGESSFGPGGYAFLYCCGDDRWSSAVDINVGWSIIPAIDVDAEVVREWKDVGVVKGATIGLYLREPNIVGYGYNWVPEEMVAI